MKKQLALTGLFALLTTVAGAQQMGAQFQMQAGGNFGQGFPGQMIPPNQGVAMDAGAFQGQFQGNGDIPAHAVQRGHLCATDRFANTNQFNFGPSPGGAGMPGIHQ